MDQEFRSVPPTLIILCHQSSGVIRGKKGPFSYLLQSLDRVETQGICGDCLKKEINGLEPKQGSMDGLVTWKFQEVGKKTVGLLLDKYVQCNY